MLHVRRGRNVYTRGEREVGIYFLAEGQVKLTQKGRAGIDCITGLVGAGDLFGELALEAIPIRSDSAVALTDVIVGRMPAYTFVSRVADAGLMEGLLQYLVGRLAVQQAAIATLLTANSEQRLAYALAMLARRFGADVDAPGVRVTPSLKHDELAEMIGTTRSRVGLFLKGFRTRGLVELRPDSTYLVNEEGLVDFANGSDSGSATMSGPGGGPGSNDKTGGQSRAGRRSERKNVVGASPLVQAFRSVTATARVAADADGDSNGTRRERDSEDPETVS